MYVVTGVTGHTGSVVASKLLDEGKPVRVIVRSEEKGRSWRDRGAEVAVVSLDDSAARGIGATAVQALLYPPAATHVIELAGPADYSLNDAAAAYSRALGKPIEAVRIPEEGIAPAVRQAGMTGDFPELMREMSVGIE